MLLKGSRERNSAPKNFAALTRAKLVGGGGRLYEDLAVLVFNDDGVAEGQVQQHALDEGRVLVAGISQVLVEDGVVEVDVGDVLGHVALEVALHEPVVVGVGHAVAVPAGGEAAELHDVAGERAGLVTEDVLDLAQLLVEVGGLDLGGFVLFAVVYLIVPLNKKGLQKFNDFEGNHQ